MNSILDKQIYRTQKIDNKFSLLRTIFIIFWFAIVTIQWLTWQGIQNNIATILTLFGGGFGISICFRKKYLVGFPVSTLIVLGFVCYYFLFPPFATFFEGKPLTNNLIFPELVLLHAFACLFFIICSHYVYRNMQAIQSIRWFISRKIYQPLNFFQSPENLHLILMGCIGLIAMVIQVFYAGGYQQEASGFVNKFMQGLYPLSYLPYVIFIGKLYGRKIHFNQSIFITLFVYTIILVVVSIGRNSRAALFTGIASIVLGYFYGLAVGLYKIDKSNVWKIFITIIIVLLASGPITNLGISMVAVRGNRSEISAVELVSNTIKTYQNKQTLNKFINQSTRNQSSWQNYVDNIFMARIANLKFADISINMGLTMSNRSKEYIRKIETERILAILPRPIINLLELRVDKDFVGSSSSGDFMIYAGTGNVYALRGYMTGSLFGNGYVVFGWWYLLVLLCLSIIIFILADSLTTRINIGSTIQFLNNFVPIFSPIVIVSLFTWFFYLTSAATGAESFTDLANYIIRGWIQILFIYSFTYWITNIPIKIINQKK